MKVKKISHQNSIFFFNTFKVSQSNTRSHTAVVLMLNIQSNLRVGVLDNCIYVVSDIETLLT